MTLEKKNIKIVAVSGGFDPIHIGHIRLFKEAKKLGTRLTIILNNDNWLRKKKGFVFMTQDERKEIIEALECVDDVIITAHGKNPEDMSVCGELKELLPDIFANGGDRNEKDAANPQSSLFKDFDTCKKLGIKMIFNVGGEKLRSSSELLKNYEKEKAGIVKNNDNFYGTSGILTKKPWGKMWTFIKNRRFWFKFLFITGRTSLQSHKERTEYQCGIWEVKPNEKHIMQHGIFVELAIGNPKEEDITRYEDDYGRV